MAKQSTKSIETNKRIKLAKKATLSSAGTAGSKSAPTSETLEPSALLPEIIVLGIDVHLRQHVVCRKIDGATV